MSKDEQKTKVLMIPSGDKGDRSVCVIVPVDKHDHTDIREAMQRAVDKNPDEWGWDDMEREIEALGYTVPYWENAGFYWDY